MKNYLLLFTLLFGTIFFANAQLQTWVGTAYQEDVNEAWKIELTQENDSLFRVNYPSLHCKGLWKLKNADIFTLELEELISEGKSICIENSLVYLTIIKDTKLLSVVYKDIKDSKKNYAFGLLEANQFEQLISEEPTEELNELNNAVLDAKTVVIEDAFSKKVYDPFFDNKKIFFDCNKCVASTMQIEISINENGKYLLYSYKIIDQPSFICKKITQKILEEMHQKFKDFFINYAYPDEMKNKTIIFSLRPTRLLKC